MRLVDLLTGEEALAGAGGDVEISGITADSRTVAPGMIFAALAGGQTDGAKFIDDAVARGAMAVLTTREASVSQELPVLRCDNPRRVLALMAARLYAPQPEFAVAVTGTNGKTSVTEFVRQIWAANGLAAASIGTLGVQGGAGVQKSTLTSPDPVTLHRELAALAGQGVTHVAIEASSHGLAQFRVDGVRFAAGAFTNISRDHLDYHRDFEDYLAQKLRLFNALLPPGASAVVNLDGAGADKALAAARARGLAVFSHGRKAGDIRILKVTSHAKGLDVQLAAPGREWAISLGLFGGFQVENALTAVGLSLAGGVGLDAALACLEQLKGARGRLELVAHSPTGGVVFVDFAHTPDALTTALSALRAHVSGRIIVVFGAGGDRDQGKRPLMGAAVAAQGDVAIITDDNPRGEDARTIRAQVQAGAPGALNIGDRATAIAEGLACLQAGDALLVAGKGHEQGQEIMGKIRPFSDHDAINAALAP
ncbi:MAG: UDP-N-acetylmuramoyl-L-alanyl-D-glutamate--2,6-diaminopimelate ligase, partial [Alphaproteobacteria bacterium]